MYIEKIRIQNFKCFNGLFSLKLNKGVNILVGNNEAGKSTIIEAVHLALSGMFNGRYLRNELTQYLFNKNVERQYISSIENKKPIEPPYILIELFFSGEDQATLATLEGDGNSEKTGASGVSFKIEFDDQYYGEYLELIKSGDIKSLPIEYYKITWRSFGRNSVTSRSIPIKSALIDSSSMRKHNGSDIYVSKIIRENLEDKEKVEISQAHRQMKESFMETPSVKAINSKINNNISKKEVKISVDLATQHAWEMSLMTYLDDVPFHFIGKGEQNIVKISLALGHRKSQEANVVLIEEPENHLSHTRLNELVSRIKSVNNEKQVIISTHSSFVANKLGLDSLIFLNDLKCSRLNDLSADTKDFFKKLAGYDTLRLVLCRKAILVEGDSDELVFQRAYLDSKGNLPVDDGVDVISVGTSFLRFLEVASKIDKEVTVLTDNDGDVKALKNKYKNYLGKNANENINIFFDEVVDSGTLQEFNYNTLEPKLLKENDVNALNVIFETEYDKEDDLLKYMRKNKTKCALSIFESGSKINYPRYITDATK